MIHVQPVGSTNELVLTSRANGLSGSLAKIGFVKAGHDERTDAV